MKKILLTLLAVVIFTGCTQSQKLTTDWLTTVLTKNLAEHNFILKEIDSQEIGYPEAKALGFNDSGVSVLVFDRNHEVYGNEKEFEETMSRYSSDKYYGEIMFQEKQVHEDVLLQYTKSAVMANHGAMQKEYYFTLPNDEMLKVKVRFPVDPETDDDNQKELVRNKVDEIHEILTSDL